MAIGAENPEVGYAVFFGIKLAGYTIAAEYLNREFPEKRKNVFVVGLTRTIIGAIFGVAVHSVPLVLYEDFLVPAYLAGLFVVRLIEWFLLLRIFYWGPIDRIQLMQVLLYGPVWSFALDLPAVLGFILTGGFWIC